MSMRDYILNAYKLLCEKTDPHLEELYNLGITPYMPYIIGILVFGFIIAIALVVKPQKALAESYFLVGDRLKNVRKKKLFDYESIHIKLSANGLLFRCPWLENPAAYIGIKILTGIAGELFFSLFTDIYGRVIGFIIGLFFIDVYGIITNAADNNKMLQDIQAIYNSLATQVRSQVYLPKALCESIEIIDKKDKRLRAALLRLAADMNANIPFDEAIKTFEYSFSNQYIDSLCLIIEQWTESGLAEELLRDISKQVDSFASINLEKKKQSLEISMTLGVLALFANIMWVIWDISMSTILGELSNF